MAAIDEKEYTQSFDWRIWKRLGPFLRPYRGAFISMLVFNGICALVDVVLPLFQKYAIQNFIEKNTLTGLLPYALAYLAVVVVQALSVVAFARNSMHIEMNLGKDMRVEEIPADIGPFPFAHGDHAVQGTLQGGFKRRPAGIGIDGRRRLDEPVLGQGRHIAEGHGLAFKETVVHVLQGRLDGA